MVNVKLQTEGQLLFTYPEYKSGWEVKANPDGTLTTNGKTFSYLFWEGKTGIRKNDIDLTEGFVVSNSDLLGFFEEKLSAMGLSSKEQQDFITYWVPRMKDSKTNYIHFLFNHEFDKYAHLDSTPEPDQIFRVFMIWDPLEAEKQPHVKPQNIPSFTRKGFSVIEWGGSEMNDLTEENN